MELKFTLLFMLLYCSTVYASDPEAGISRTLAKQRKASYSQITYNLRLELADTLLRGQAEIGLKLTEPTEELILDWRPTGSVSKVANLKLNGASLSESECAFVNEHIVIHSSRLQTGTHLIELSFESPISPSGSGVVRYSDKDDGSEYVYTLLVPSDASTVFPCFDQPDLKARFRLSVTAPEGWTVVANSAETGHKTDRGQTTFTFAETEPISTYLFAFAAGPFAVLKDDRSATHLFVRRSKLEQARIEAGEVFRLNREAVSFFSAYFGHPFPFAKYDLVVLPDFPYNGMEHAGATFLRESTVLFPSTPRTTDILARAQLIFHETAHQWFGDLVTMRWFDDLWLKEGFANFCAAKATEKILPQYNAWNFFHNTKSNAYRTDGTAGTTPVWQELANLSAAKSAYGSIVYSKAPSILRQAEFYFGTKVFERGVRLFVRRHAYSNAEWRDLVAAFETASGRRLGQWAEAWVRRRSMPEVICKWEASNGKIKRLQLHQQNALSEGGIWPMRLRLVLGYAEGRQETLDVMLEADVVEVKPVRGRPVPLYVFANGGDFGYGRFLLDPVSRQGVIAGIGSVQDGLLRTLLWEALWEDVRRTELAPLDFLELALKYLPTEEEESTVVSLLSRVQIAFNTYLSKTQRQALATRLEELLWSEVLGSKTVSLRSTLLRTLYSVTSTREGLARLKSLLEKEPHGMQLSSRDRFELIAALLAAGDPEAPMLLAQQSNADRSDNGRKYAFIAGAAEPSAQVKQRYFEIYQRDTSLPERWIEESLANFNTPAHHTLTARFLQQALEEIVRIKKTRKIFFVNSWLAAFLGGQVSRESLAITDSFLQGKLDRDLRLKVLEFRDGLERAVMIREKFATEQ